MILLIKFDLLLLLLLLSTPLSVVRKKIIPTERPPLVGEVSVNVSG
jgi:hypothetical protein